MKASDCRPTGSRLRPATTALLPSPQSVSAVELTRRQCGLRERFRVSATAYGLRVARNRTPAWNYEGAKMNSLDGPEAPSGVGGRYPSGLGLLFGSSDVEARARFIARRRDT